MSMLSTRTKNAEIGARLEAVRAETGLTQESFADQLGITPRSYGSYERGDREIPMILFRTLYEKYAIDPIWFLTGPGKDPVRSAERRVNGDLLAEIIEMLEDWLLKNRKTLRPDKKARVIRLAYEHCALASRVDQVHLTEMLSLAA